MSGSARRATRPLVVLATVAATAAVVLTLPALVRTAPRFAVQAAPTEESPLLWPAATHALPDDRSPDGRREAYVVADAATGKDEILLASPGDRHGGSALRCRGTCLGLSDPAFAPDGARLVMIETFGRGAERRPGSRLVAVDLRSSSRRVIATSADGVHAYSDPRWTSDGSRLVVELDTVGAVQPGALPRLMLVPVSGGPARAISTSRAATQPDVRRGDDVLVFVAPLGSGGSALVVSRLDGSDARRVTVPGGSALRIATPRWTADGGSIDVVVTLEETSATGPGTPGGRHQRFRAPELGPVASASAG